jgi:RNA polymerase sigma-70 factor (ECF subfamily)
MHSELPQIYDEHAQALFAFLLNLCRKEWEAEDLLQAVFLKLTVRPGLLRGVTHPRAYLLRLTHNLFLAAMRKTAARLNLERQLSAEPACLFAEHRDPDDAAFGSALAAALGAVPEEQRAVLHLKIWEQMTFAEIAEILGISPNTAASRHRYGLTKLQDALRPIYEEIQR